MAYEYTKNIQYGIQFLWEFPFSKADFLHNNKGRKHIQQLLKKASTIDIFSQWVDVEQYLYERLFAAVESLGKQKQWSKRDIEVLRNTITKETLVEFQTTYDWYKALDTLSNHDFETSYPTSELRALYIAHTEKMKDTSDITTFETNNLKSSSMRPWISDFLFTHDYNIITNTTDSLLIEYLIVLYSMWIDIILSISKDSSLVFYTNDKYLDVLNRWAIWYSLNSVFDFLFVDSIRDDIEQIEKYFKKEKLLFLNRNEKVYEDLNECIQYLPYWEINIQVQDWYLQMMEYKFKSSDCSQSNFKKIQDFVFGRWIIWYEYHQGIKKNIIWSKKFNYRKQIKQERIANDS